MGREYHVVGNTKQWNTSLGKLVYVSREVVSISGIIVSYSFPQTEENTTVRRTIQTSSHCLIYTFICDSFSNWLIACWTHLSSRRT
jgi:hypothetical protein